MGFNQILVHNPVYQKFPMSIFYCNNSPSKEWKNGFMSHTQHFLNSGMKVYGALNSLTSDFLQFG